MVVGDVTTGTELLVIGGGPGGYVAAIRAAQRGVETTLVDRDALGGTCLNYGCIPSKAYLSATDLAHRAGTAEEMGVHADPVVDVAAMRAWKDGVVDRLTGGVEKLCAANGVTLIEGTARFRDAESVRVAHGGEGRGAETVAFERCVLATGSRPTALPGFDFGDDPVLSSRAAFELDSVPDRLVVVGAGYVGMELSTVFARLGADVTVVEALDDVLPGQGYEADVRRIVRRSAERLGVEFRFGEAADGWRDGADGGVVVETSAAGAAGGGAPDGDEAAGAESESGENATTDGDGSEETTGATGGTYAADRVLVAVGRDPVTDTVDLGAAGVETDDREFVPTDDQTRTNVEGIHAVGDVAGDPMLAHAAMAEGAVAAAVVAGDPAGLDYQAVPAAVFTDPEVAVVGLTEADAAAEGFDPVVGQMSFGGSGRALTTGRSEGFVRVVADAETGFVLGGQIVGPEASELVAEVGLAIEMGATLEDVAGTVHTHPTLSEAVHDAVENALGEAIHTPNR